MTKDLNADELLEIEHSTVGHYESRAEAFWEGTKDHDVAQNLDTLLRHIEGPAPFCILDFGCGPGRDLIELKRRGHEPVGLDGTGSFCVMAREKSECEVLHQNMLALALPDGHFDGIFANASMFHIPTQELPRVLRELRASLKPSGVLFASNPRGENAEGWNGARFGAYHDYPAWKRVVEHAGFEELEHYYRPKGLPREQQPWLATVFRRK